MAVLRNWRCQLEGAQPCSRRRDVRRCDIPCFDRRHAVFPASTVMAVPVMLFDPSPMRKSTALAISSMSTRCLSALQREICRRSSMRPPASAIMITLGMAAHQFSRLAYSQHGNDFDVCRNLMRIKLCTAKLLDVALQRIRVAVLRQRLQHHFCDDKRARDWVLPGFDQRHGDIWV